MSNKIRLSQDEKNMLLNEFATYLDNCNGKVRFEKEFTSDESAELEFTELAWLKMNMLVATSDKEVAWHGVCSRVPGQQATYLVEDILVYPQSVSAATVDMDVEDYSIWLMENADNPQFDKIRMQGHSHVNMGVSPSGTDIKHQNDITSQLDDNDFYIFLIINKKQDSWAKIIDYQRNLVFNDGDIVISVRDEIGINHWLEESIGYIMDDIPKTVYQTQVQPIEKPKQTPKPETKKGKERDILSYLYGIDENQLLDPFYYRGN